MVDNKPRPAIPAWQRAQQPLEATSNPITARGDGGEQKDKVAQPSAPQTQSSSDEPAEVTGADQSAEESVQVEENATSQLDMIDAILQDPAVNYEPTEKKRALLQTKNIPEKDVDEALSAIDPVFKPSDFETFQQRIQSRPAPPPQQKPAGPPIITYPEFLVDAHKPPPLITPGRIAKTAYAITALATLTYGASKFLVSPMITALTEARHEFAEHSQSKLEQFNERLAKIGSNVPETKRATSDPKSDDEAESVTSDSTELYDTDMDTQTSPPALRRSSSPNIAQNARQKDTITKLSERLAILQSHLNDFISSAESDGTANKDGQDSLRNLRHYLDSMMYSSVGGMSVWDVGAHRKTVVGEEAKKVESDAIEEFKKEIRGFKGVLLSAKRFPIGAMGRVGV